MTYLFLQSVGTVAWWWLLVSFPGSISWFQPRDWPADTLRSFWLADAVLIVAGSIIAGIGVAQRQPWAGRAVWTLAAVTWYPTLVCIATSLRTDQAWLASALMVSMSSLMLAVASIYGTVNQTPATIRATPMSRTMAMTWTFAQTAIFWCVFLWIIPRAIAEVEHQIGWPDFDHFGKTALSLMLFGIASLLGLWSGFTMAFNGRGTPLPTATAPELVVAGPYRIIRNPMALAGIAQGVAVGWFLGSPATVCYAVTGAFLWHWLVRPVEEVDLFRRFGDRYAAYRSSVGLWLPNRARPKSHASSA